ncbi:MAG: hypothetical protein MPN21_21715 [Thermoanaerobaculia bacterium]|nr:hypothetical protein [Thermoanaerobaculia bacterium]
MDSPLHLKTDQDSDEFTGRFDGALIGRARDQLDSLAYELGVLPLSDFVTVTDEDLDEYVDDEQLGVDHDLIDDSHDEDRVWFKALDGLDAVAPLIQFLQSNTDEIDDQEGVLRQLRTLESCLQDAKRRGILWHFALDR